MAPMTGISDLPFRQMAARFETAYAATEMVACAELENQRPDVVRKAQLGSHKGLKIIQLIGRDPIMIAKGARLAEQSGADIIDLNFGCPAKEVTGVLCGSALMRDLDHACEIIDAALSNTMRPVTIKMRLGWDENSLNAAVLAQKAENLGIAAITVHGRTRQQFYKGQANWNAVSEVKKAVSIPVIVNGDVIDETTAKDALQQSGADAIMIGRATLGQPWMAQRLHQGLAQQDWGLSHSLVDLILEHMAQSLCFYGDNLGLKMFKKHLAAYVEKNSGDDPIFARESRATIARLDTPKDIEAALWAWDREKLSKNAA